MWTPCSWSRDAKCKSHHVTCYSLCEPGYISHLTEVACDIASLSGSRCSSASAAATSKVRAILERLLFRGQNIWAGNFPSRKETEVVFKFDLQSQQKKINSKMYFPLCVFIYPGRSFLLKGSRGDKSRSLKKLSR